MHDAACLLDHEEPRFPEDEGGPARRLDFLAHTIPPLYRELRRELAAHYARRGLAPAWYVGLPFGGPRPPLGADELPRLTADAGPIAFLRSGLLDRWREIYAPLPAPEARPEFVRAGLPDPEGCFRVHGAGAFVILADLERLGERPVPRGWADLFDARYRRDIALNGDRKGPQPLLLANLARDFGAPALAALGRNTHGLYGGGEMARAAGSARPDRAALSVLPWFWAGNNIHDARVRLVWPEEGAYCTPMVLLARRELTPGAAAALKFITGPRWTERMESVRCVAADREHARLPLPGALRWIGWSLARQDGALEALVADAAAQFQQGFQA